MRKSHITGFGEGFKNLTKLTSINLFGCQYLTRISDFSGVPNLVRLELGGCTNLTEVDPSVGFLNKLEEPSLVNCYKLTVFPTTISLKSLRYFGLDGCKKFEIFPEIVGKMESLNNLRLRETAIKELPPSIENLTGLKILFLDGCKNIANLPQSIYALPPRLEQLRLSGCPKLVTLPPELPTHSNISLDYFGSVAFSNLWSMRFDECNLSDIDALANFGWSSKLHEITLRNSSFESLPACIGKFVSLQKLDLCGCKRLGEILELPPNIRWINVRDCILLETFPTLSKMIWGDGDRRRILHMDMSNCQRLCENQAGKCYEELSIILPGSEVPNWFSSRKDLRVVVDGPMDVPVMVNGTTTDPGCLCEIFIEIPRTFKWKNTGLVFCAAFKSEQRIPRDFFSGECGFDTRTAVNGVRIDPIRNFVEIRSQETDAAQVWLKYIPLPAHIMSKVDEGGDQSKPYLCRVSVGCSFGNGLLLNGCGVHLANCSMPEDGGEDDDDVGGEVRPRKKKRMLAIKG